MRRTALALLAAIAVLLAACSDPLPQERREYAGDWRGAQMRLLITPEGRCEYSRRFEGGRSSKISAPILRFDGDNIVVGVGFMNTTFVVSQPPRLVGGHWKMVVDGVELTRFGADEVRI
jgi:hypothetical protein